VLLVFIAWCIDWEKEVNDIAYLLPTTAKLALNFSSSAVHSGADNVTMQFSIAGRKGKRQGLQLIFSPSSMKHPSFILVA
jgi:hypothetical protein